MTGFSQPRKLFASSFQLVSILMLVSILFVQGAQAGTWYVSALNGIDSPDCGADRAHGCQSIQTALSKAQPGDVIILTAEAVHVVSNLVITLDSLTFVGEDNAVVRCNQGTDDACFTIKSASNSFQNIQFEIGSSSLFEFDVPPTPSPTPSVTAAPTPVPTVSPSNPPTITPTGSITSSASATPSISETSTVSASASFSSTASVSPSASITPSLSSTGSITPSTSLSASITPSLSSTPSVTPSVSASPSFSSTASPSAMSLTSTSSPSPSNTASNSATASITPSNTPSASITASITGSATSSASMTPSISITPSTTASISSTPSTTVSITPSSSSSPTPSSTTSISSTNSASPTASSFPTPSSSSTASSSPSFSSTASSTPSLSSTATSTMSASSSSTPSASSSPSSTASAAITPSSSGTATSTASPTPSTTKSSTGTPSSTATAPATPSAHATPSTTASSAPTTSASQSSAPSPSAAPSSSSAPSPSSAPSQSAAKTPDATQSAAPSSSSAPSVSPSSTLILPSASPSSSGSGSKRSARQADPRKRATPQTQSFLDCSFVDKSNFDNDDQPYFNPIIFFGYSGAVAPFQVTMSNISFNDIHQRSLIASSGAALALDTFSFDNITVTESPALNLATSASTPLSISNWKVSNFNTLDDEGAFALLLSRSDDDPQQINISGVDVSSSTFSKFIKTAEIFGKRDESKTSNNFTITTVNVSNCTISDSVLDISPTFEIQAKHFMITGNKGTNTDATIFRDMGDYVFADFVMFSSNSKLSVWQSFSVVPKLWACRNFNVSGNTGTVGDSALFVINIDEASEYHFNDFTVSKNDKVPFLNVQEVDLVEDDQGRATTLVFVHNSAFTRNSIYSIDVSAANTTLILGGVTYDSNAYLYSSISQTREINCASDTTRVVLQTSTSQTGEPISLYSSSCNAACDRTISPDLCPDGAVTSQAFTFAPIITTETSQLIDPTPTPIVDRTHHYHKGILAIMGILFFGFIAGFIFYFVAYKLSQNRPVAFGPSSVELQAMS